MFNALLISEAISTVRSVGPLIHCITNYVTVNDCANVLLAYGASPVMSDSPEEVAEIVSISSGLNINIGTLNKTSVEAMLVAGKRANDLGTPVTLDPVGVGASNFRKESTFKLLEEVHFATIRGNMSEMRVLAQQGKGTTKGVDVSDLDVVDESNWDERVALLNDLAKSLGSIVVASGAIDISTDGYNVCGVRNGSPRMTRITGCGCMLTSVVCAFVAACRQASNLNDWEATTAAVCAFGASGELAEELSPTPVCLASYRNKILDVVSTVDPKLLEARASFKTYDLSASF